MAVLLCYISNRPNALVAFKDELWYFDGSFSMIFCLKFWLPFVHIWYPSKLIDLSTFLRWQQSTLQLYRTSGIQIRPYNFRSRKLIQLHSHILFQGSRSALIRHRSREKLPQRQRIEIQYEMRIAERKWKNNKSKQ